MWLLDAKTHQLDYHPKPAQAPPYAALSHSWSNQEITLADVKALQRVPYNAETFLQCASSRKILKACVEAQTWGLQKLWVDSLCVDWSSSQALSEDINSMFHIYQCSQVCFAYIDASDADEKSLNDPGRYIEHSKWRNRVWMLQELIAPPKVWFYNQSWKRIGTKDSLIATLSMILCIDEAVLQNSANLSKFTIGRRMSWAAQLSAPQPEDVAYSLLGIFNVRMPILYGEKNEAFLRLQEQILKDTKDATLLLWRPRDHQQYRGLLARSPAEFSHFSNRNDFGQLQIRGNIIPSSVGLFIEDLFQSHKTGSETLLCLIHRDGNVLRNVIGIRLRRLQNIYVRSAQHLVFNVGDISNGSYMRIRVNRDIDARMSSIISRQFIPPLITNTKVLQEDRTSFDALVTNSHLQYTKAGNNGRRKFELNFDVRSRKRTFDTVDTPVGQWNGEVDSKLLNCQPQTLILNHGIISAVDMSLLVECGLRAFTEWYPKGANNHLQPEAVSSRAMKRCKTTEFENQIKTGRATAKKGITMSPENMLACPFQLQNPHKYGLCLKHGGFSSPHSLKQHLLSEHERPYHCPICRRIFNLASVRDEHITERSCVPDEFPEVEGLNSAQIMQLSRRFIPSQTKNEQWNSIWHTLFHNAEPPATIHPPARITHYVLSMSIFWSSKGLETLLKVMGSEDFQGNMVNIITDDALTALNQKVLDQMVNYLLGVYVKNEDFYNKQIDFLV